MIVQGGAVGNVFVCVFVCVCVCARASARARASAVNNSPGWRGWHRDAGMRKAGEVGGRGIRWGRRKRRK